MEPGPGNGPALLPLPTSLLAARAVAVAAATPSMARFMKSRRELSLVADLGCAGISSSLQCKLSGVPV